MESLLFAFMQFKIIWILPFIITKYDVINDDICLKYELKYILLIFPPLLDG